MDVSVQMTGQDLAKVQSQVDAFNKTLSRGTKSNESLDQDAFLKILITQLTHQDPTSPMQDKDFIAQMAQFSSLEQITNMSQEFAKLSGMIAKGQAVSLLGKNVEIGMGGSVVHGKVEGVTGGDYPQVLVNGKYFDYSDVQSVIE